MPAPDLSYVTDIIITMFFIVPFVSVLITAVCAIIHEFRKFKDEDDDNDKYE